jgi:hypothetical protein
MKTLIAKVRRGSLKKLAIGALAVGIIGPVAQAKDKDRHDDVNFGVSADNHGNFGLDLSIFSHDHDRDRFARPVPCERVWVDAVWVNRAERVWVDAVYVPVRERVWCPPVTKEVCTRVWVEPTYEDRETVTWQHGRRVVIRERVQVCAGHYEERKSTVVVTEGRYDTVEKWVLKCDGHWETRDNWVCASEGHYEDRPVAQVDVRFEHRR